MKPARKPDKDLIAEVKAALDNVYPETEADERTLAYRKEQLDKINQYTGRALNKEEIAELRALKADLLKGFEEEGIPEQPVAESKAGIQQHLVKGNVQDLEVNKKVDQLGIGVKNQGEMTLEEKKALIAAGAKAAKDVGINQALVGGNVGGKLKIDEEVKQEGLRIEIGGSSTQPTLKPE